MPVTLTQQEQTIISLKYKSKRIGLLTAQELQKATAGLLIRIAAVTGWQMPTGLLYTVMEAEFQSLLKEMYSDLNADEIAYAFRSSGHLVEEYGKSISPALISKVLVPYLDKRYEMSGLEERIKSQKTDDGFLLQQSDDWFRGEIQQAYSLFFAGERLDRIRIHVHFYDILVKDGFIQDNYYKVRLKVYQHRLLATDEELVKAAKVKTVHQLYRMHKQLQKPNIYTYAKAL